MQRQSQNHAMRLLSLDIERAAANSVQRRNDPRAPEGRLGTRLLGALYSLHVLSPLVFVVVVVFLLLHIHPSALKSLISL